MANAAELIREYKTLFDSGVITQEEFNSKKDKFLEQNSSESHEWIECVINGKAMLDEGLITEEDFGSIKSNVFADYHTNYITAITDIRELNELLSDGAIDEEDYDNLKGRILKGEKIYTLSYSEVLRKLKATYDKDVLDDANYTILKNKYLNTRTDPHPNLNKNITELTLIHKLLDEGLITPEEYEVFEKDVASGKSIRNEQDISPIRDFKDLLEKGFLTEEDFDRIRKDLLFGKKNLNYIWPDFLEEIADIRNGGAISDEEYTSLKSAFMEGSKLPEGEAFERIRRYLELAEEGIFDADEIDILKDRAFSGVEVLTDDKLNAIRDYKKLLDEGTISNDDFKQYKSNQLVLGTGKKYVIMDAGEIKKKKKKTRKTIIKVVVGTIVMAALVGVLACFPKLMAHKAASDLISDSESLFNEGKYDEVSDKAYELLSGKYNDSLFGFDEAKLTTLKSYAYSLEDLDYTNGGGGIVPEAVFNNMEDIKDYGIMPYLYESYDKFDSFVRLANEDGKVGGEGTLKTTEYQLKQSSKKTDSDKDKESDDKDEQDKEKEKVEYEEVPVTKNAACEADLSFGFTKKDINGGLTEDNLIPSGKIEFSTSLTNDFKRNTTYVGVFPLDQTDSFEIKQKGGNNVVGKGHYEHGTFTITFGDDCTILFNKALQTTTSKSSSSSSSSSSSKSSSSSSSSKSRSSSSSSSSSGSGGWSKNPTGNGYINEDGYVIYDNNGVTEITDGKGNWAQDTDGDGNLDTFGSDSW